MYNAIGIIIEFIAQNGGEYTARGTYFRDIERHMVEVSLPEYLCGDDYEQFYELLRNLHFKECRSEDEQRKLFARDEMDVIIRF